MKDMFARQAHREIFQHSPTYAHIRPRKNPFDRSRKCCINPITPMSNIDRDSGTSGHTSPSASPSWHWMPLYVLVKTSEDKMPPSVAKKIDTPYRFNAYICPSAARIVSKEVSWHGRHMCRQPKPRVTPSKRQSNPSPPPVILARVSA